MCGKDLGADCFSKDARTSSGYSMICNDCKTKKMCCVKIGVHVLKMVPV